METGNVAIGDIHVSHFSPSARDLTAAKTVAIVTNSTSSMSSSKPVDDGDIQKKQEAPLAAAAVKSNVNQENVKELALFFSEYLKNVGLVI